MYFVVHGEYELQLQTEPIRLGPGNFFCELELLNGETHKAAFVATPHCSILAFAIGDFHDLLARQPELARVIREAARERLGAEIPRSRVQMPVAVDEIFFFKQKTAYEITV